MDQPASKEIQYIQRSIDERVAQLLLQQELSQSRTVMIEPYWDSVVGSIVYP